MRENKFRAWDNVDMKMYYTGEEDNIHFYFDGTGIVAERFYNEEVCTSEGERDFYGNSEKLEHLKYLEYTGITDKNGTPIYEGDIVKNIHRNQLLKVMWQEAVEKHSQDGVLWMEEKPGFRFEKIGKGMTYVFPSKILKIIGNIYENPELLEVEANA